MSLFEEPAAGRTFDAPWEARAFALALELHTHGVFSWSDWSQALATAIIAAGPDDGRGYYEAWLAALESLVAAKDLATAAELRRRAADCERAFRATPHGAPVRL